jgi:hypothetical protein
MVTTSETTTWRIQMANRYTGILSGYASDDIDFNHVESLLGFEPHSLLDITWEVVVYVSGKYIEQTYWQPSEYPEISDTEISNIFFNFSTGEISATAAQIAIMEQFKPDRNELYWDVVPTEMRKESVY